MSVCRIREESICLLCLPATRCHASPPALLRAGRLSCLSSTTARSAMVLTGVLSQRGAWRVQPFARCAPAWSKSVAPVKSVQKVYPLALLSSKLRVGTRKPFRQEDFGREMLGERRLSNSQLGMRRGCDLSKSKHAPVCLGVTLRIIVGRGIMNQRECLLLHRGSDVIERPFAAPCLRNSSEVSCHNPSLSLSLPRPSTLR